jgi:hypothetical protein
MPTTFQLIVGQNRTKEWTASIFEQDGVTPAVLVSGDYVRFKVSMGTGLPLLDLVSGTVTSHGSTVVIESLFPASVQVKIAQGDTEDWAASVYDAELGIVDAVDSNYFKTAMIGTVVVVATAGGNIGV